MVGRVGIERVASISALRPASDGLSFVVLGQVRLAKGAGGAPERLEEPLGGSRAGVGEPESRRAVGGQDEAR